MVVHIEMVVCPNIFRGHPIIDHFLFEGPSSWLLSYADQLWMTTTVVKSVEVWDESSHSFSTTHYYTFKGFFFTSTQSNKGRQSLLQLSGMEAGEEGERKRAERRSWAEKKKKLKHALEINLLKLESQTFILILGFVEELKKAPFSRGI